MAKKAYYFLTNEDPGRLNPYTVEQLQRLFSAKLISPTTEISNYEGSSTKALRDFIDVQQWQEKQPKGFQAKRPFLKTLVFLFIFGFLAEVGIVASSLGSIWEALEWNRQQLMKVVTAVANLVRGPEQFQANDYLAVRYVGDLISIYPGCDLLPKHMIPRKKPLSIRAELRGVGRVEKRIFVFGQITSELGLINNFLLTSDDEGLTWLEAAPRIPDAQLNGFLVLGSKAWVVGNLVRRERSVNPFFLRTLDGGVVWKNQSLRPFDQPGSVVSLKAESEQLQATLFDPSASAESRYKSLHSSDLGQNWLLQSFARELSKTQPALAKDSAEMRVRQEEGSSIWLVERLRRSTTPSPDAAPDSWQVFGRFANNAGSCAIVPEK
jgi:hypothetical protein